MPTGSCLCGSITFSIDGEAGPASVCHCGQCRKQAGGPWISVNVEEERFTLTSGATLSWFRSSDFALRGFCTSCGGLLFWKADGEGTISVGAGAIDPPTGAKATRHIFTGDKGDYYDIDGGLPQRET